MKIKIFQINPERDHNKMKFADLRREESMRGIKGIDAASYDEVFAGDVEYNDLEDIYRIFNTTSHPLHRGHSLSVSDVVVTDTGAYICAHTGFDKVDFDESLAQKPDGLMKVVYVEPHKSAYAAEISHTLDAMQRAVGGGLIEPVYNDDGTIIVCNDEGKLIGMEGNRHIDGSTSIIAGPFFICGDTGEEFGSLTDEEIEKYTKLYAEPEDISPEEVEADTGFFFYPM